MQQSAPMSPRAAGRLSTIFGTAALTAFNLTCARPIAAGPTTAEAPAPATVAAAASGEDAVVAPLPLLPRPPATIEHTELRALGKTIARHVDRGFETLIVSTG